MDFCREAFDSFKRRVNQFFPRSNHLPEASVHRITSLPASSAVNCESVRVEQNQQQQNESSTIPAVVKGALLRNLDWQLILIGFCLESAVDIALHSIQTNAKIPLCLQLVAFSILLAFASLFVATFVNCHLPMLPKVLEQAAIFFAVTAFFIAVTTPFHLFLKLISWAIYTLSFLAIIFFRGP